MKKDRYYYIAKIRVNIEDSILCTSSLLGVSLIEEHVNWLMTIYLVYGIDALLTSLELGMNRGLYYISIRKWDKIIDIDDLIHHC